MHRFKVIISGQVQGISFRNFIKERAKELDLKGYVKNKDKNKIEILVEGHELIINKLIDFCNRGPLGAEVKSITKQKEPYKAEFKEFKIKA